jgi:cell division septation protein DedD
MSKSKEFRELQFSSGQLVAVFLGVLVVGVIVFILGVSVGKKHGLLSAASGGAPSSKVETLAEKTPAVAPETEPGQGKVEPAAPAEKKTAPAASPGAKTTEPAAKPADKPEVREKPSAPAAKPSDPRTPAYFVQIGAVEDRAAATAFARRVEKAGFVVLVLDPLAGDKKTIFRVRLGPFGTKQEAEDARTKAAAALKKRKADFFVVRG